MSSDFLSITNTLRCEKQYLIKWSGLNEHNEAWDDTWEPVEYIEKDWEGAQKLEIFLEKRKAEKTSKAASRNRSQDEKSGYESESSSDKEEEYNEINSRPPPKMPAKNPEKVSEPEYENSEDEVEYDIG